MRIRYLYRARYRRRPRVGGLHKVLLRMRERFLKFPRKTLPFQPVIGGVLVGVMGWFVPQVVGVGYEHATYQDRLLP